MHFAYIDGGSASMALQVLLAGVLSAGYALYSKWTSLKRYLARKSKAG